MLIFGIRLFWALFCLFYCKISQNEVNILYFNFDFTLISLLKSYFIELHIQFFCASYKIIAGNLYLSILNIFWRRLILLVLRC